MSDISSGQPVVSLEESSRKLKIEWPDGQSSAFHYVWLRHSARCSEGMPNDTSVKIDLLPDAPESLAIADIEVKDDVLLIDWQTDGLQSRHGLATLRQSAYDAVARKLRKHQPALWDRESAGNIPGFDYRQAATESGRLELMLAVRDYGVAKLRGVPTETGSVAKVAAWFGPLHVNNYGGIFDVQSDARLNLGSNTGHYLPPHTDESAPDLAGNFYLAITEQAF